MKRTLMIAALALLAACENEKGEGGGGTADDTSTACNEANEDCSPGTCGGEGGQMLPGADCLACHDGTNGEAGKFTAAGTVFSDLDGNDVVDGATVRITDADGNVVELTSNAAGNFYTSEALTFPISAEVELDGNVLAMSSAQQSGGCNACHACAGPAGGKLYAE